MAILFSRDEEVDMMRWVAMALMLILGLSGCMVSKTKYEGAVSDMESAKAELEKGRMHQEALEEQIRNLKGLNEKISTDLEMMTTEVQRIKEGRKNEHTLLETRERELDEEKAQLITKLRVISAQYQKIKAQNNTLKKTVLRYKKELKDSHGSPESTMGRATWRRNIINVYDFQGRGIKAKSFFLCATKGWHVFQAAVAEDCHFKNIANSWRRFGEYQ